MSSLGVPPGAVTVTFIGDRKGTERSGELSGAIFRNLGTTPISGKSLSEREQKKGHSRSSGRVPGYSLSSSRSSKKKLGMRNPIFGMASHDLSNATTTILRATPGIRCHTLGLAEMI